MVDRGFDFLAGCNLYNMGMRLHVRAGDVFGPCQKVSVPVDLLFFADILQVGILNCTFAVEPIYDVAIHNNYIKIIQSFPLSIERLRAMQV